MIILLPRRVDLAVIYLILLNKSLDKNKKKGIFNIHNKHLHTIQMIFATLNLDNSVGKR